MIVGVLALQGAFREHEKALRACGVDTLQVRLPEHLKGLDALVIPGGESTTMGKLLIKFGLFELIKDLGSRGMPIFGTCAGLIMLAKDVIGSTQPTLELMDISVERNAFGRQVDSFETDIQIPVLGEQSYNAVFIRAPYIVDVNTNVEVLATYKDKIILARQNNFLVAAFHPELTEDLRLHQLFLSYLKA